MRIDKFLKVSRLIKRRTVANQACDSQRVKINGRVVKAGAEVKVGDVIEMQFGPRLIRAQVENILEHVSKDNAADMYKIIT